MIYVFLAPGFEEIEALAPIDMLRRAELDVKLVGVGSKQVTGSHGICVECDLTDMQATPEGLEMIVLPGGLPGTLNLEQSPVVQQYIDFAVSNNLWIGAICAAPSILGHKGLLEGKRAICYPGFEQELQGAIISDRFFEVDGKFVTAKGVGVAMDFGVLLVECLLGKERAEILRASLQCRC